MQADDITVTSLVPGADIISAGGHTLALGFPEEVVKVWMQQRVAVTAWIIPDVRSHQGIAQWALEFPLYHALFVRKLTQIPVLVTERDWPHVVQYLRLTLLGLSREEMIAAGVSAETADMLARESDYLALKDDTGAVAPIERFLRPVFFDHEGVATLDGVQVKRHGGNTYSVFTSGDRVEEHHLVPGAQTPPYTVQASSTPLSVDPFSVTMLGASNGFDPSAPCSNQLVQCQGRLLLVDAGPFIRHMLRASGVSLNQLSGVVITHAHEDHAVGLSQLLELRHKVPLFVSRENAAILRQKLAILNHELHAPERLLDDAFDVTYVEPGVSYDFYGMTLRFHYTLHSIPCTGVEFSYRSARALIMGDSDSRAHIRTAFEKGAISQARYDALEALYGWTGDLIVADAGEGAIHGAPIDFINSEAMVVYVHTGKLSAEYTLARAGYRYSLIAREPSALERSAAQRALTRALGNDVDVLLDASSVVDLNPGHVLVREGDTSAELYVLLAGELAVSKGGRIEPGEIVGERAGINGEMRGASVAAEIASRVLVVPGAIYKRFAQRSGLTTSLPALWRKRRAIDAVGFLASTSSSAKNLLAAAATEKTLDAGATIIREGSRSTTVFVLVSGRVQLYKGAEPMLAGGIPIVIGPGNIIGEQAPFLGRARSASAVALDECEVLAISGEDFKRIVEASPQLFCHVSRTVKARAS